MTRILNIPAITICQPWAWAIAEGHKLIENREWPTRYRGKLAIHAGLNRKWFADGRETLARLAKQQSRPEWRTPPLDELTLGAIVAIVDLIACDTLVDLDAKTIDRPIAYGRLPAQRIRTFAGGPFCWILAHVRKLREPIACRGMQGLWNLTPELQRALGNAQTISAATPSA